MTLARLVAVHHARPIGCIAPFTSLAALVALHHALGCVPTRLGTLLRARVRARVCVCVRARASIHVRACVFASYVCVNVCVRGCVLVFSTFA